MSKSILVIDTPEACINCPCHFADNGGMVWCGKENKILLTNDIETFKPVWCPLHLLPEKKPEVKEVECKGSTKGTWEVPLRENEGWNACIDEIIKLN